MATVRPCRSEPMEGDALMPAVIFLQRAFHVLNNCIYIINLILVYAVYTMRLSISTGTITKQIQCISMRMCCAVCKTMHCIALRNTGYEVMTTTLPHGIQNISLKPSMTCSQARQVKAVMSNSLQEKTMAYTTGNGNYKINSVFRVYTVESPTFISPL